MNKLAITAAAAGLVLLALDIGGLFLSPDLAGDAEYIRNGVPGYHYPVDDGTRLRKLLNQPAGRFDLEEANSIVFNSIAHTGGRRLTVYENWVLYLLGLIYPPAGRTQDPQRIAAGRGGLCSEVSAVLIRIAAINGQKGRFISLGGHTAAEIYTEGGWKVADPDYGVSYDAGLDELEGERGKSIMEDALHVRGYPDSVIARYTEIFQSSGDNRVLDTGVLPSPGLYRLERVAERLKWIIPLFLITAGFVIFRRGE